VLDGLEVRCDLLQDRNQRVVHEDDLILTVVDDVGQLLREQPDVERVQHRAQAGHAHVDLEVLLRVPHEGGYAIAIVDAELAQRLAESVDAIAQLRVGLAGAALLAQGQHDLVAVHLAHATQDVRDRQLKVLLHQAFEHRIASLARASD
jgi:hypothetical protein